MFMYDLYKAKCTAEEIIPASSITYRRVFCNEFNFSFHKLKKTLVSIVMFTHLGNPCNCVTMQVPISDDPLAA
jgi:hypothetical protein